jgi:hypothetical protein
MELHELLEEVHDRTSFFAFVAALIRDREEAVARERANPTPNLGLCPDAGGWYNFEIETYLEAALAWAEATEMGVTKGLPEEPSWKAFAVFLYLGKIYE